MALPSWWAQRRFGLLVHASLSSVPSWAPIGEYSDWYRAHVGGRVSDVLLHPSPLVETLAHHRDRWGHVEDDDDFLPFLDFGGFDPDEWAGLARDGGVGYLVAVAKHHDGLCWWDAPGTDRTVVAEGPRRDVLAAVAAACERADLVFGTYYSLLDWSDRRYPSPEYVAEVVHPQVLDLVRRYDTRMLWGDGHWGGGESLWRSDELVAAALDIDPGIAFNDRWWSERPGVKTFEYRLPPDIVSEPWEMRRGIGTSFGYNRAEGPEHLMTAGEIVSLLTEVVAKGGHLLLGVGVDAQGRIPELHADRLRAAGGWIRRHRELVDRGQPWTVWGDADCRYLVVDEVLHAIDVSGQGRFAALRWSTSPVGRVETIDGNPVEFVQTDDGVTLDRPPRRGQRLPQVYRIVVTAVPAAPARLFGDLPAATVELADLVRDAAPGTVVQLGEGTYLGPARIPDGVVVRGLGPDRTVVDGLESCAVTIGAGARIEHCTLRGGTTRIVWIPRVVARVTGGGGTVLGCRLDGHIAVDAPDARIVSCTGTGVVSHGADRVHVLRSQFAGMHWDWAVELEGGTGHVVESCEFRRLLGAIHLTSTVGVTVRGNRCWTRWWGVLLSDAEATAVSGNSFERVMRSVDVHGGSGAEVTGNAAAAGDSGCVVQGGATDCVVSGNRWERTRIGLLTWGAGAVRHHDNMCVDLGEPDGALVSGP
jgi:alpha-L-fucosidase